VIALDLGEHRVAESEALVAQLLYVLGVEVVLGLVEVAHSFEQTDGQERIDRTGHGGGKGRSDELLGT
jgi:hypothetical protein